MDTSSGCAALDGRVARLAGHKATAEQLKSLSDALDADWKQ
jgi:phosphatidylserine synthase